MHKKHIFLLLSAIILLGIGFSAGNQFPRHLASELEAFYEKHTAASWGTPKESAPLQQAGTPVAAGNTAIQISDAWPEKQQAADYWKNIHSRRSGVNLNAAGGQAKAALDQVITEADTLASKGDSYSALQKLRQALEWGADDASVWLKFADLSARSGDSYNAINGYLIAEARNPGSEEQAKLYAALAEIYDKRGDSSAQTILALQKSLAAKSDPVLQQKLDTLRGQRLELLSVDMRNDGDTPEACLTFSWALHDDGSVAYEDYLQIEPATKVAAIATDKQLCLRGFAYGQNYEVTVKSGLPAMGGSKLADNQQRNVSFSDRTPAISFQSNTYILPRLNNLGIPLRSVNVDVAKVEILQINDRNLVSQIIDGTALREDVYSYYVNQIRNDHGRSLWSSFIDLKRAENQSTSTAIPFASVIKDPKPGLYAVVAQIATKKTSNSSDEETDAPVKKNAVTDAEYEVAEHGSMAVQWVVVTDVGLTTYQGQDGIHVIARSYESGKPIGGVKLRLLSRDNTVIADSSSDAQGHAKFAEALLNVEGGKSPKLLQAFGPQGDFTFLDLQQPALDLSDRGVDGRDAAQKLDAYLYSDRGIYRPGEDIFLSTLLRDQKASALPDAPPLTLKIFRPDGVLFKQQMINANNSKLGGYHTLFNVPDNARMGMWRADVFADPTEPRIGTYNWQVEDFVPARLDVKITLAENAALKAGEDLNVPVQADYLYGAPASGASGDASLDLKLADNPFKDFADYKFGLLDSKFDTQQQELTLEALDEKGAGTINVKLDELPPTSHPIEALLHASVFDDNGRAVNRTAVIPVDREQPFIGIRETSVNKTAGASEDDWNFNEDRGFDVIAVNRAGTRTTQDSLRYRLVKEEYYYDWFTSRSERNYQQQIRSIPVKSGELKIAADVPATVQFSDLDYGTYRLEVFNPSETTDRITAASIRFNVGWMERSPTAKDKPDSLQLRLNQKEYRAGDRAQLFVKAPFAGQAELVIARENVIEQRVISLPAEGTTLSIPVSDQWGAGVYVLVHAYRAGEKPVAGAKSQTMPGRAVGVIWLGMDPKPRTLDVKIDAPEKITPRQQIQLPIQVVGAGSAAEVTIAAVDEGILQLTGFNSPEPEKYFYAKRKLGVDIRDAYGRLLDPSVDAVGNIRSGGDQAGRSAAGLPSKWIKSVALFSGPVALDATGRAVVPIDVPEFNGKLRFMAVAYNTNQLGHAESKTIVRDPVVVNMGLPRFMAPQDNAKITLNLDNVDGPKGTAKISLTATGGIKLGEYAKELQMTPKQKQQVTFDVTAEKLGSASLQLALTLPDGTTRKQEWPLTVRPIQTYQTRVQTGALKPDEKLTLDEKLLAGMMPEDAILTFSISAVPDLQLARVIKQLDRYPYGCLEQTSSRLLPLLYLRDIIEQAGIADKNAPTSNARINQAINRLLSMQKGDGSFSLWSGYGPTEDFISLYVIDVLQRAQQQDFNVPDYALRRAYNWLQNTVRSSDFSTPVLHRRAYSYYLLARAGLIEPGQVRYFAERYGEQFQNRLSHAFTAAALTQIGDQNRAAAYWEKAMAMDDKADNGSSDYHDYGSSLRDKLITLSLAAEAKINSDQVMKFANHMSGEVAKNKYYSTQENGWIILASHAMYQNQGEVNVTLNGEALPAAKSQPILKNWQGPNWSDFKQGQVMQNTGTQPLHYSVAVNAIPVEIQPAVSEGFTISRKFYARDGNAVDLANIKANDMLVAVIEGEVTNSTLHDQSLLVDLLPAGLELESANFGQGQNVEDFAWIGATTTPTYQELRDDRFIAAFDPANISNSENEDTPADKKLASNKFRFAYAVRAVTKGDYQLPATQVEAMYQPEYQARTSPEKISIKE